jgi:hypothetical protein
MNWFFKFLTALILALTPIAASAQIALTGAGPGMIGGSGGQYLAKAVHFTGAASLVPVANTITAKSAFYSAVPIAGTPSCTNCGTASQVNTIVFGGGQLFGTPGSVYISGLTGSGANSWSGTFPISTSRAGTLSYACANCGSFVSTSSPRVWTAAFPVSSCAGINTNASVYDRTPAPNAIPAILGNVKSCSGTTLTLTPAINSTASSDALAVTGAIASSDSCSFILSFWHRGTEIVPKPAYNADAGSDFITNTYSPASSEQAHGLNLALDGSGLRLNAGNHLANSSPYNSDTVNLVISPTNVLNWLSNGNWHHILWTMNTCGAAQGTAVSGGHLATGLGMQVYIDGVQRISNSLAGQTGADGSGPQTYTQWRTGIAWGDPGGFTVNFVVNSTDSNITDDDWADLQLWVGKDIVCGGTSGATGTNVANPTSCASTTDIVSPADVSKFINGGVPVSATTTTRCRPWMRREP